MFPVSDSAPRKTFPIVNLLIIALNIFVFYLELISSNFDGFTNQYGFIPAQFKLLNPSTYISVFTSLFVHGGFFHIISNMWFLFIFGDNVEDKLGHFKYLLFYLAGGFFAAMGQYFFTPQSIIPMIGASGAISAVAWAYFVFFRNARVKTLLFIFVFFTFVDLPVWLFLGYWFFLQIFNGLGSLVSYDFQHGGVAFFAHVAGFMYGLFIARRLRSQQTAF